MDKKQMRAFALAKRDALTKKQREADSEKIISRLMSLSAYQKADAILTYVSFRSEVDTFPLIHSALAEKKAVFAPKVLGREMAFFKISSVNDLREGYRGILEPEETLSYDDWNSQSVLICLPGAAFDRNRHRIGYGGGFYDRYLSKTKEKPPGTVATAALAFSCQIFEEIPWEVHDIRPACIVTERETIV